MFFFQKESSTISFFVAKNLFDASKNTTDSFATYYSVHSIVIIK